MALYGTQTTITYVAWDTANNTGKTGDVANHTLRWVKDGTASAPTNSASEVDSANCPGLYKITLTSTETQAAYGVLAGKSSTSDISIMPVSIAFEDFKDSVLSRFDVVDSAIAVIDTVVDSVSGVVSGTLSADVVSISGDTVAADNLEAILDDTGGQIKLVTATDKPGLEITSSVGGEAAVDIRHNTPSNSAISVSNPLGGTALDLSGVDVDVVLSSILTDTGTTIPNQITGLNNLSTADIDSRLAAYDSPTYAEMLTAFDSISTLIVTVDSNVDAILVDTSTTLPNQIDSVADSIASDLATVDSNVDAILVDTSTTIPAQIDSGIDSVLTAVAGISISGGGVSADSVTTIVAPIKVKTDLITSGTTVTITSPVSSAGKLTVYSGDDMDSTTGRAINFTSTGWADLTGGAVYLSIKKNNGGIEVDSVVGTLIKTNSDSTQEISFGLTSAQTASMTVGEDISTYKADAVLSNGKTVTLTYGDVTVVKDV